MAQYPRATEIEDGVKIETDCHQTAVTPKGKYRTGVLGGTFLDKKTGARDLGHGLNVTDFPCIPPTSREWEQPPNLDPMVYGTRRLSVPVEGPQLCTASDLELDYDVAQEETFVLIHQWFTFTKQDETPGSRWDEWLLFPDGKRFFFAFNKLTSGDRYPKLSLCGDWPGHIKGDDFENIYLSYHGVILKDELSEDLPPDEKFLYQRDLDGVPERMIRAYQIKVNGKPGPWLASMTLDPAMIWQGWCHRRGYICLIGFLGGIDVMPGDSFSNVNLVGYFDSIDEMNQIYDRYKCSKPIAITDFFPFISD